MVFFTAPAFSEKLKWLIGTVQAHVLDFKVFSSSKGFPYS